MLVSLTLLAAGLAFVPSSSADRTCDNLVYNPVSGRPLAAKCSSDESDATCSPSCEYYDYHSEEACLLYGSHSYCAGAYSEGVQGEYFYECAFVVGITVACYRDTYDGETGVCVTRGPPCVIV